MKKRHALHCRFGIANLDRHDADTDALFDQLPQHRVVLGCDGKAIMVQFETGIVECSDQAIVTLEADEVSLVETGWRRRVSGELELAGCCVQVEFDIAHFFRNPARLRWSALTDPAVLDWAKGSISLLFLLWRRLNTSKGE